MPQTDNSILNRNARRRCVPGFNLEKIRKDNVFRKRRNDATRHLATRAGLPWTSDEVAALRTKATACELAARLGRSQFAIQQKRRELMTEDERHEVSPVQRRVHIMITHLTL